MDWLKDVLLPVMMSVATAVCAWIFSTNSKFSKLEAKMAAKEEACSGHRFKLEKLEQGFHERTPMFTEFKLNINHLREGQDDLKRSLEELAVDMKSIIRKLDKMNGAKE